MEKKQRIVMMTITEEQQQSLRQKNSMGDLQFVDITLLSMERGFHTSEIIFKKNELFYLFRAIEYMNQVVYTTPFRVWPEIRKTEHLDYTTFVDEASLYNTGERNHAQETDY